MMRTIRVPVATLRNRSEDGITAGYGYSLAHCAGNGRQCSAPHISPKVRRKGEGVACCHPTRREETGRRHLSAEVGRPSMGCDIRRLATSFLVVG